MNAYQVSHILEKVKNTLTDVNYLLEMFMRKDKENTLSKEPRDPDPKEHPLDKNKR